jgi:hypothetical protein
LTGITRAPARTARHPAGQLGARYPERLSHRLHRESSSGSNGTCDISFLTSDLNGFLEDLALQCLATQGTLEITDTVLQLGLFLGTDHRIIGIDAARR